jgi:hypothetical protein
MMSHAFCHRGKIAFFLPFAGENVILSGIPFSFAKKPNWIPHKYAFLQE